MMGRNQSKGLDKSVKSKIEGMGALLSKTFGCPLQI